MAQLKLIATIDEANNVRSSQPSIITSLVVLFDIRTSWHLKVVFIMNVCDTLFASVRMLKSSLFNPSHSFKVKKIKDSGVLYFSFFIMNHFMYACMGREGGTEGEYVPKCTYSYSQGGRSKISTFCARSSVPNQKRVTKKLAKFMKSSNLNSFLMQINLQNLKKLEATTVVLHRKGILKISQIHRKTPVLKSFLNKVAGP